MVSVSIHKRGEISLRVVEGKGVVVNITGKYINPNSMSSAPSIAREVIYNNSASGLAATNVQSAIDEVLKKHKESEPILLTQAEYEVLVESGNVKKDRTYYIYEE